MQGHQELSRTVQLSEELFGFVLMLPLWSTPMRVLMCSNAVLRPGPPEHSPLHLEILGSISDRDTELPSLPSFPDSVVTHALCRLLTNTARPYVPGQGQPQVQLHLPVSCP